MSMLNIEHLGIRFGSFEAVKDVSLSIEPGEMLALVGESGSGKTTLGMSIGKLLPPTATLHQGKVLLDGRAVDPETDRGKHIAYIFQDPFTALNPVLRIGQQLIETIQLHQDVSQQEARAKALALLEQVHIPEPNKRLDQYPHQLSGGQRQRVCIAMALTGNPKLLIADEPTTALDVTTQAEILKLLKALQQELNLSVLLITHDLGLAAPFAERIAVMQAGKLIEVCSTEDFYNNPKSEYTQMLLDCLPTLSTKPESTPTASDAILSFQDVSKHFAYRPIPFGPVKGWVKALDHVTFELNAGEALGLVGESGCGKSTLARILCGWMEPTSGQILYKGKEIIGLNAGERKNFHAHVQMIFQDPFVSLNPRMRIGDIVAEPLIVQKRGSATEITNQVASLLKEVGIDPDWVGRFPQQLSGGQRQRVGIARALALNPELLICDEATSSLDLSIQKQILDLLRNLRKERQLAMLFISHDLNVVSSVADRVLVMQSGVIVEQGTTQQIFQNPQHAYTQHLLSSATAAQA